MVLLESWSSGQRSLSPLPLEPGGNSGGEDIIYLPNKLVNFSNYLWVPVKGCEKEISTLMRKLESEKGHGVKVLGGKRVHPSTFHLKRARVLG